MRRVLKPQGTVWWNIGDTYNTQPAGNKDLKKSSGIPNTKENLHKRKDNISKKLFKGLKAKDLMMIPALKKFTNIPIIYDPSHSTGYRDFVVPVSKAAIAIGADG